MSKKPHWWAWDLELSPHLLKRMIDRGFTEVDLRRMIEDAFEVVPAWEVGRGSCRLVSTSVDGTSS